MSYEYKVKTEKPIDDFLKKKIITILKKHSKLDFSKEENGVFSCHLDTVQNTQLGWWDLNIEVSDEYIYINRTDSSYVWKDIEEIKFILDKECIYEVYEP